MTCWWGDTQRKSEQGSSLQGSPFTEAASRAPQQVLRLSLEFHDVCLHPRWMAHHASTEDEEVPHNAVQPLNIHGVIAVSKLVNLLIQWRPVVRRLPIASASHAEQGVPTERKVTLRNVQYATLSRGMDLWVSVHLLCECVTSKDPTLSSCRPHVLYKTR